MLDWSEFNSPPESDNSNVYYRVEVLNENNSRNIFEALLELGVIPHLSFDLLSEINIHGSEKLIVYRFTVCSRKFILKKKIYYPPLSFYTQIHKNLKKKSLNHSQFNNIVFF